MEVFDEIGSGGLRGGTAADDLFVGQHGGLDDHLEHDRRGAGLPHRADVGLDRVEVVRHGVGEVDHHVHLVGTLRDRICGLGGLDRGIVCAGGESAHRGHLNAAGRCDGQTAR